MQGRKLAVLMWKHLMVRMRRFIHTPVELLSTIVFLVILFCFKDKMIPVPPSGIKLENQIKNTDEHAFLDLGVPSRVYYTPATTFTNDLMKEAGQLLGLNQLKQMPNRLLNKKGLYAFNNFTEISDVISSIHNDEAIVEISDPDNLQNKLSYTIRMTNHYRTNSFESGDTETHRNYGTIFYSLMSLQWAIDTSFIELLTGKNITQKLTIQEFPSIGRMNAEAVVFICELLLFLCWISLFLVFVFLMARLMEERSTGIQELVKMMGVSSNLFGISHFLNVLPAGLIYSVVGTILLKSTSNPLIPHSSWLPIFVILLLHFVSIVAAAFCCSYITQSTQYTVSVSVFVYILLWLPCNHIGKALKSKSGHIAAGLLPHEPMAWLWQEIAAMEQYGEGLTLEDIWSSHTDRSGPVALGALFLILQSLIFFALAWYLSRVRPGKYGQALPCNFLFQKQYWSKNEIKPTSISDEEEPISRESKYFEATPKNVEVGIKIENVTKVFPKHKALSNVTLDVLKGEITVLLGHNGAGKTTLMSIITGMMSATEGRVLVNGADVSRDAHTADSVRRQLGLCPQHNLFFADLTVLEHAMFFTLLKGGSYKEARQQSYALLKSLGLEEKGAVHSSALSGGMKRRLQLACALAGGASVLVLDEPTSGLDVETRRELWDLLLSLRGERTVLLTTHFMEEADALGDRVAAVHQGHLRCHATPMYLKRAIGTGYRLTFTTNGAPRDAQITTAVTSHVPEATLKEKTINSLSYNLPASASGNFPELFSSLESKKSELHIETIGVGVTTLEEVFLKLCSDTETMFADDEADSQDVPQPVETHVKHSGLALYARQFCVLIRRQLKYIWHKKISFLSMQVVLPVLIIFLFTQQTNNSDEVSPTTDKMSLDLDLYQPLSTRRALTDVTDGVDLRALSDTWPKVDFMKSDNITGAVLKASQDDPTEYNKYLVGIEITDNRAKALFTTTVRYAAPVALNLLTNALATQYIGGATGRTFSTYYYPMNTGETIKLAAQEPVQAKNLENILVYGVVVIFVVLATNINNVSLPCAERESGARHIHLMSGCPAVLHWAVTLCFHMTLCVLVLVLSVAVAAALLDNDHTIDSSDVILTMCLVLIVGSLAFFALMYLVSCCFAERGASIILIAILIVFGLITTTIKTATDQFKQGDTGLSVEDVVLSICSYIAPPHAMTMAFLKTLYSARLNALCELNRDTCPVFTIYEAGLDTEKCCKGEKPISYMSSSEFAPAKEIITLAVQFVVFMTLVILTQYGVFNKLCDYIMNTRYRHQIHRKGEVDEIVRAEAVFVEKQIALPQKQIGESEHALLAHDLHKNYINLIGKNCNAVKGTSFSVKKGECFGLLGVNGAGKSTTFKMLTAEQCPTQGDIYANGHFRRQRAPYLQTLGYCPQFFGLDDFLTGHDNLELVMTLRGLSAPDVERETRAWIQVVGLEKYRHSKVCEYSGGCKRRVAAGAALCSGAALTLLDEPTAGVDVAARRRVWAATRRALRQHRALLITSHSMDEMQALCHRIAIMSGGVVRALGTPSELRAHHAAGHAVLIKVAHGTPSADEVDSSKTERDQLKTALQHKFNCTLKDEHKTMLHYHINESMRYSDLFTTMEELKSHYPSLVEDYSVTETTLEEVFLSIAKEQQRKQEEERAGRRNHVV